MLFYLCLLHIAICTLHVQSACKALGGFLAEPLSVQEMNFIKKMSNFSQQHKSVWLGGEDLLREGQWFWANSLTPVAEFTGGWDQASLP